MPDSWEAAKPDVRRRLQQQRVKNTSPELRLRTELHRRGRRFRIHVSLLTDTRRTVDIAFPRSKVAVDVRGCFWHGCPDHYVPPRHNARLWADKVEGNRRRDADNEARLRNCGWRVVVIWEHVSAAEAADLVEAALDEHIDRSLLAKGCQAEDGDSGLKPDVTRTETRTALDNTTWRREKLDTNMRRDERNPQLLQAAGWELVVVWQHDDISAVADGTEALIGRR